MVKWRQILIFSFPFPLLNRWVYLFVLPADGGFKWCEKVWVIHQELEEQERRILFQTSAFPLNSMCTSRCLKDNAQKNKNKQKNSNKCVWFVFYWLPLTQYCKKTATNLKVSNSLSRCRCWWRWRAVWASSATCEGPCWPSRAHAFPPEQRAWCSASGAPTSSTWPRCQRWYSPRRRACAMPASAWRRTTTAGRSTKRRLVTYLFCLKKKKKKAVSSKAGE